MKKVCWNQNNDYFYTTQHKYMKVNFETFAVGSKIDVLDYNGYLIMEICGEVVKHVGDGHAVIKNFSGFHFSTVGFENKVESVEPILNSVY